MQNQLEANHPELANDKVFVTMKQTSLLLNSKLEEIIAGITNLRSLLSLIGRDYIMNIKRFR